MAVQPIALHRGNYYRYTYSFKGLILIPPQWSLRVFFCFSKSCHARGQKVDWARWLCSFNEVRKGGGKGGGVKLGTEIH